MSGLVHYELEVLFDTLFQPLCENQRGNDAFDGDDVEMSVDEAEVTCPECLKALGYQIAPDTQRVQVAA